MLIKNGFLIDPATKNLEITISESKTGSLQKSETLFHLPQTSR